MSHGRRRVASFSTLAAVAILGCTNLVWGVRYEVGRVDLPVTGDGQTSFVSIQFAQPYPTVPVVTTLATADGGDPTAVRIRNVTTTGFEMVQVEPPGEDGQHAAFNNVDYLVAEVGRARLSSDTTIEAGTHDTMTTAPSFDNVSFSQPFDAQPMVLAHIQTTNNEDAVDPPPGGPAIPWMTTSINSSPSGTSTISTTGFEVALDQAEAGGAGSPMVDETIGYAAISQRDGNLVSRQGQIVPFKTFISPDEIDGWDDGNGANVSFPGGAFASAPHVIASMATRDGVDGGWLRRGNITASQVNLRVDEDQASDMERGHTTERASIAAFGTTFVGDSLGASPDLLIHYNFEPYTQNGSQIMDDSGNQNHGSLGGDAMLMSGGIQGSGLALDGDNDFLTAGDIDELDTAGEFTVSLWFNRDTGTTSNADGPATNHNVNNVLIAQSSGSSNDNLEIGTSGADVEVYLDTQGQDGPNPFSTVAGISDDVWHHLALTYDSARADEMSLFVDGMLITSESQWGGNLDNSTGSPLTFGLARPGSSLWGDFTGKLDEVQIYTRALRGSEVRFLANNPGSIIRVIPEPGSAVLVAVGIAGLVVRRRRAG